MTSETKKYIAVVLKDKKSDFGVIFPDFPGCISAGKTISEATTMAEEALQLHVDGMISDAEEIPSPLSLDKIHKKYKKAVIFLNVAVRLKTKATRINITLDEKLLRKLDRYIASHHVENRSIFFAQAIESACQ